MPTLEFMPPSESQEILSHLLSKAKKKFEYAIKGANHYHEYIRKYHEELVKIGRTDQTALYQQYTQKQISFLWVLYILLMNKVGSLRQEYIEYSNELKRISEIKDVDSFRLMYDRCREFSNYIANFINTLHDDKGMGTLTFEGVTITLKLTAKEYMIYVQSILHMDNYNELKTNLREGRFTSSITPSGINIIIDTLLDAAKVQEKYLNYILRVLAKNAGQLDRVNRVKELILAKISKFREDRKLLSSQRLVKTTIAFSQNIALYLIKDKYQEYQNRCNDYKIISPRFIELYNSMYHSDRQIQYTKAEELALMKELELLSTKKEDFYKYQLQLLSSVTMCTESTRQELPLITLQFEQGRNKYREYKEFFREKVTLLEHFLRADESVAGDKYVEQIESSRTEQLNNQRVCLA